MNLLSFIPIPMPIRTGSGCDISTLPPYSRGILIASCVVGFVALICLCLTLVFEVFGYEDGSKPLFKTFPILLTLVILLIGIALLCALIGV